MRGLRLLACGVALATVTCLIVGFLHVLGVLPSEQEDWIPLAVYPFLAVALLSPTLVGLLIALQLPRNRIAWILLLGALLPCLQLPAEQVVGAAWSFQSEAATLPLLFVWPVAVALVFPTGHLLSRRWRWVVWVGVVSFGATIGLKLFEPEPYPPPNDDIRNPVLGNAFGQFIVDPASGSRSQSGWSRPSSRALSRSSSASADRSGSSACRCCGSSGARR